MPGIRIVTDTTASLPAGFAAAHGVVVVPQVVSFGAQSFQEDIELSAAALIERLTRTPEPPHTAAPEPGWFVDAYRRQLAGAETVLSLHPSSEISGTVRSALTAKASDFPDADIRVLDTRTVAGNLGALVQSAVAEAEAGQTAGEIMARLQALIPRARTFFLVPTLEYLRRGGRIGGAQALLGGVLQIKPLLELRAGRVEALERVRTHHRALARLQELVVARCPRTPEARLSVLHAGVEAEAAALAAALQAALGTAEIPLYPVGAAITVHAGPGTLGVAFFE
ncbi:MAG: DegV family protein [Anaerolineales bacterium]|nr:DegV family protein [Anaerolineales bacterium]